MLKEISIEIIRKCPNNCLHCSSFSNKNCSEIIPYELFKKVVSGAKNLGLKTVCFSGGEPFLHPDIIEMIEYVYDIGLDSYVYSSGIYMDKDDIRGPIPQQIFDRISNKVTKIIYNIEATLRKKHMTLLWGHMDVLNSLKSLFAERQKPEWLRKDILCLIGLIKTKLKKLCSFA